MTKSNVIPLKSDLKETDLIYAAGFLDGEGCFELLGPAHKSCIRIKVYNSYKPVIDWFLETFGGSYYNAGRMSIKPMYAWSITGENCVNFCKLIIPFLKEKKRQAEIIVEFRDLGTYSWYDPPPKEVVEQRQILKDETRSLKLAHY